MRCRDREGGRAWRIGLSIICELPPDAPDFACPWGLQWGYQPPSKGLGDTVKKIIDTVTFGKVKPCGGCKKRRKWLNEKVPYKADAAQHGKV